MTNATPSRPDRSPATGASKRHGRFRAVHGVSLVVVALSGVAMVAACSDQPPPFDRAAAVQQVLDESQGGLTRPQAECYVNRVADEVGSAQLAKDAKPTPSQISRLTSIRIDCVGVANLGRTPSSGTVRPVAPEETSGRRQPQKRGDDANLDLLYNACAQGNGQACDNLFDSAPPGSEYEEFAVTCGGRTREKRCAEVYNPNGPAPAAPTSSTR